MFLQPNLADSSLPQRFRAGICSFFLCSTLIRVGWILDAGEKKLGKVIVPDKWKEGASNTNESGGRKINENKLLSKKNRSTSLPSFPNPPPSHPLCYWFLAVKGLADTCFLGSQSRYLYLEHIRRQITRVNCSSSHIT